MKSKLPVPTAKDINDAHRCARESAECAVEWAVKCGQMLKLKKDEVGHGNWESWVEKNCEFTSRSASAYMKVAAKQAQIGSALPISSIRQALEEDKKPKSNTPKGAVSVVNPEGGRTTGAKEGTEETGNDRPAAPVSTSEVTPEQRRVAQQVRESIKRQQEQTADDEPERPDDIDEDAALAAAEADYMRRVDAVMQADNKLAEAQAQLKQQAALISTLEATRDGYMRGKDAVTKLLQAEQRKVARLEKENKSLRERLAALEGKAA